MPVSKKKKAATTTRALGPKATATRERILLRSVQLFNQLGVHGISTQQIAADLAISPGNFNYYFPRKRDLIEACLDLLQERLHQALSRNEEFATGRDGAEFLVNAYSKLWDFRFFFNGLTEIVTEDAPLRKKFIAFNEWAIQTLESDSRQFAAQGVMLSEPAPNTYRLLAENVWAIWLNWVRMQHISHPTARTPSKKALYQCGLNEWSVSQAWLTPAYSTALLSGFKALLLDVPAENA